MLFFIQEGRDVLHLGELFCIYCGVIEWGKNEKCLIYSTTMLSQIHSEQNQFRKIHTNQGM